MIQVDGKERKSLDVSMKKENEGEHASLTSDSTAPSSSGSHDAIDARDTRKVHNVGNGPSENMTCEEDSKPPALVDLSFSVEAEDEKAGSGISTSPQANDENNDNDETSQSSESTLLSDLSSIEEKHDLDRLEDDFVLRGQVMEEMVKKMDPRAAQIVKEYEKAMQTALRQRYESIATQGQVQLFKKRKATVTSSTVIQRWNKRFLLSETAQGVISLVLYCVAHLSCWEMTTALLYELTQNYESQCMVHVVFLAISLVMLRLSGGIFGWLGRESYEETQTAIHNVPDARLLKWFRRHPNLKALVNMLAFYICWTAVSYFQNCGLQLLDSRETIAQGLPSYHSKLSTAVKDKLVSGLSYDDDVLELEAHDFDYLLNQVSISSYSQFMGDELTPLVSTLTMCVFFGAAAVMSISVLRFKLGHTFEI